MPIDVICIIAAARTGSSRFCQLLRNCPEFNVVGELFNNRGIDKVTAKILRRAGLVDTDAADEAVRKWVVNHPDKTITALRHNRPHGILVFKIFKHHLPQGVVDRRLFSRPDIGFVLLRRTPIESFISQVKAETVQAYHRSDTTALKPNLDAERFTRWATKLRDWYVTCEQRARASDRPFVHADYQSCVATDNIAALTRILTLVEELGVPRVALPDAIETKETVPQDREPIFANRVANWPEFEASIATSPESAALLHWATSPK